MGLNRLLRFCVSSAACGLIAIGSSAHAAFEEVQDETLSQVSGADGVSINLHLEWNASALTEIDLTKSSSISIGFHDETANRNTSLVFQGFGGIIDLWGLRIDARSGSAGDYVDITLPALVTFAQFGFRALYAENHPASEPPSTPVEPNSSYGKWLLNGSASVTGNVYIWPSK